MEAFLIRAAQLILSLAILVLLHEFGHFGFARLFRVRVDKFYIFFNPKFSLLRAKKINGKWRVKFFAKNVEPNERMKLDNMGNVVMKSDGKTPVMEPVPRADMPEDDWRRYPEHTEWGIGWLPLGGYCKIAGMVDESMDRTQLAQAPKPWEYRSRSVWQRLPIIIGGVLVNFLLALIIYAAVLFTWGKEFIPLENAKYGLSFSQPMIDAGFQDGDKIVSVDGLKMAQVGDAVERILVDKAKVATVEREGQIVEIEIPNDLTQKALASGRGVMDIRYPFVVDKVQNGSPAADANLQSGDSIVGINGKSMSIFQDISEELVLLKGATTTIAFVRNGETLEEQLQVSEDGKLGVYLRSPLNYLQTNKETFTLAQSIPAGIKMGVETLGSYVKQFKLVFTKEGVKSLGGFGAIGNLFPPQWNWQSFWLMTAFLSVILAFMNFLPIPGLDGGYVLFLLYEMITGRKPSDRFMEYAQSIGMILLLALVLFANGNDIFRAFFK
ncbi:MAG: RIP metalloprotease RseP [Porphyromonadaceae bacterium]|nr:RIP metalloprotease RseP [Porphyromonadaceae bacterium]